MGRRVEPYVSWDDPQAREAIRAAFEEEQQPKPRTRLQRLLDFLNRPVFL